MKLKRLLSAFLAVSVLALSTGCSTDNTPPAEDTATESVQPAETTVLLSNPVAVDENGEVDMEVALAYETDFDALLASLDAKTVAEGDTVSENTNEKTKLVFDWLRENYGKNLISGQQVSGKKQIEDILYYMQTGDLPAIKGFDFIFTTMPHNNNPSEWTDMAIEWHQKSGGLVSFCWHWNVPRDVNQDPESTAYAFYSEDITNFSLKNAVTPGTKEYEVVVHDIDLIAIELQKLEAAGVPVLWRPLHEASGAWFWWGVADREIAEGQYYQKLWYMIYDRLENYHKLTNLIWVWNGQSKHTQVHPGTYDISGIDVYPTVVDHSAQAAKHKSLTTITADGKMLTLSEVGYIPDPDEVFADESVNWLYFMPWNGEFVYMGSNIYDIPKINLEKMTPEFLKKVYAHEKVITWSELPMWEGTAREIPSNINEQMIYINMTLEDEAKK